MSHSSHYTEMSDTLARADSARDARHNGGDWPAPYRPLWIHRATRKRHASTCAWLYEGLRLSLVVWLSQYQRRCGQWTPMNIELKKEVTQ